MVLPTRCLAGQALGQAPGDLRVLLVEQRLGQQRQRPHRGLQLVADVGHEVAAHVLQAAALGRVLHHHEHARWAGGALQRHRPHAQDPARRPEQLELALAPGLARRTPWW